MQREVMELAMVVVLAMVVELAMVIVVLTNSDSFLVTIQFSMSCYHSLCRSRRN